MQSVCTQRQAEARHGPLPHALERLDEDLSTLFPLGQGRPRRGPEYVIYVWLLGVCHPNVVNERDELFAVIVNDGEVDLGVTDGGYI